MVLVFLNQSVIWWTIWIQSTSDRVMQWWTGTMQISILGTAALHMWWLFDLICNGGHWLEFLCLFIHPLILLLTQRGATVSKANRQLVVTRRVTQRSDFMEGKSTKTSLCLCTMSPVVRWVTTQPNLSHFTVQKLTRRVTEASFNHFKTY